MALFGDEIFRRTFFYNGTYLSNYYRAITGEAPGYTAHFWSLAVEEQFYLIWPWLILFVPLKRLLVLIVTFILLGPAWRIAGVLLEWDSSLTLHATPACMDTLGAGALLALRTKLPAAGAFRSGQWRRKVFFLGLAGFVWYGSMIGLSHVAPLQVIFGDTAIALFCLWMIDAASRGEGQLGRAILEIRPVVYLGKISYGIYALHLFVPNYGRAAIARLGLPPIENDFVAGFIWAILTVGLAALSWKFYEGPINRLKRHFPYKDKMPDEASTDAVRSVTAS